MFNLDDRVVYPGHGVAKISRIITKLVGGRDASFYELKFINKDMTILVPTDCCSQTGMRSLSSTDKIDSIFKFLAQPAKLLGPIEMYSNWKQRNKEYQSRLRTGILEEVSKIYRELKYIEQQKGLSFCEKTLLSQTEMLLAEEIALVSKFGEDKAIAQLRAVFNGCNIDSSQQSLA